MVEAPTETAERRDWIPDQVRNDIVKVRNDFFTGMTFKKKSS